VIVRPRGDTHPAPCWLEEYEIRTSGRVCVHLALIDGVINEQDGWAWRSLHAVPSLMTRRNQTTTIALVEMRDQWNEHLSLRCAECVDPVEADVYGLYRLVPRIGVRSEPSKCPGCKPEFVVEPSRELLDRIRGEFLEMPDLKLTTAQGCRLWNLAEALCRDALDLLRAEGFLVRTRPEPTSRFRPRREWPKRAVQTD
jgi:hypothetical protein